MKDRQYEKFLEKVIQKWSEFMVVANIIWIILTVILLITIAKQGQQIETLKNEIQYCQEGGH